MINVDIAQIEILTDLVVKAASDSEEILNRLRSVSSEIHDDVELPLYTQSEVVLEAVAVAIQALNRGSDTMQSLKGALITVAELYRENEKKNKDALNRMTAYVDSLNTTFNAAVVTNSVPQVEHDDLITSQNQVQQLVANSTSEMQAINIAAVTRVVKEEYEVQSVEILESDS